jgi:hypothetical protein
MAVGSREVPGRKGLFVTGDNNIIIIIIII